MNDSERRRYEMLRRVRDFGVENAADFPPPSVGGKGFTAITAAVAELEAADAESAESRGARNQTTQRKAKPAKCCAKIYAPFR